LYRSRPVFLVETFQIIDLAFAEHLHAVWVYEVQVTHESHAGVLGGDRFEQPLSTLAAGDPLQFQFFALVPKEVVNGKDACRHAPYVDLVGDPGAAGGVPIRVRYISS